MEQILDYLFDKPYRWFRAVANPVMLVLVPGAIISWGLKALWDNMAPNIYFPSNLADLQALRYRPVFPGVIGYYVLLLVAPLLAVVIVRGAGLATVTRGDGEARDSEAPFRKAFIIGILAALVGAGFHLTGVTDEQTIVRLWGLAYVFGVMSAHWEFNQVA